VRIARSTSHKHTQKRMITSSINIYQVDSRHDSRSSCVVGAVESVRLEGGADRVFSASR